MSSQPDVYPDSNPFARTMSAGPPPIKTRVGISEEARDAKIKQFEDYLKTIIKPIQETEYTADEATIEKTVGKPVYFFYFIGRLNPPHAGHIAALQETIDIAKENNSKALILLGSGPTFKDGRDRRTMDDPITFETKKAFVVSQIRGVEGTDYIIKEMINAFKDVPKYIAEELEKTLTLDNIQKISINHIAGGKDADATKLKPILGYATTSAQSKIPGAQIVTDTVVSGPLPSGYMSATNTRKAVFTAYKLYTELPKNPSQTKTAVELAYEQWPQKYKDFYGPKSEQIFTEILYPVLQIPEEADRVTAINNYLDTGVLPPIVRESKVIPAKSARSVKDPRSKKTGKGGSNRRKSNKRKSTKRKSTKRKSTKRNSR